MFTGCRILMQLRRIGSGLGEDEGVNGKTRNGARTTLGPSRPLPPPRNRWFADSPLEGTGFEPSVPPRKRRPSREAPRPTIVGSRDDLCLMTPSSLSVRHLTSATAERPSTRAGPMVRIRFPPAQSHANSRSQGGSRTASLGRAQRCFLTFPIDQRRRVFIVTREPRPLHPEHWQVFAPPTRRCGPQRDTISARP